MFYIYYKDKLNSRQNKPFIDYFIKIKDKIKIVSNAKEITIDLSEITYIFVGTMEFFDVFFKYFFKKNVKIIYRSRGVAPEESFYRNKSKLRYIALSIIELIVASFSKHIIVVSENHKNHYIKKYRINQNKISVVHNYLTSESYKFKKNNYNKMEVVYVGGLAKWQKINEIKNLFEQLNIENKEISFLICTNKENMSTAKTIFKNVSNISFESYDNYNDLINRISQCTAGVILRDSNIVNECSSPFKVCDYLSAQLPIIMTKNIGDYSNILKNKRFVFQLDNTFSKEVIIELDSFIKKSLEDRIQIKKEMSQFTIRELDAEVEIKNAVYKLKKLQ
ncbi:hypothetical protein J7I93_13605 [Bacillus sp. ISL-47]|uniref:hypothetical protein n=1 Tax=Bacillus sp. ISL-47 TaxID=2819130 RepID=UPI001BE9930F|nr:hypothetical protein [Bacillus sp. ISL-47]MBT2689224.1 hypothetical protein [Bacillus sp. ISL-47]MBT2708655.1 hypothetical protein [Pseudomonas sp. ISL-84]